MRREGIAATNVDDRAHFLLVEINGDRMQVTPLTYDADGNPAPLAIRTADNEIYSGLGEPVSVSSGGSGRTEVAVSPYHPIVITARPSASVPLADKKTSARPRRPPLRRFGVASPKPWPEEN